MDVNVCSLCQTSQNAVDNLTGNLLLVNSLQSCGHKFCQTCVNRQFAKKRQFACPLCGSVVKSTTLSERSLEELEVAKDLKIRRYVKEIYNKREDDFTTLREYNDYQEKVEDLIFNLVNGISVPETEAEIEKYRAEHAMDILVKQSRLAEEERTIVASIEAEKTRRQNALTQYHEMDLLEQKKAKELIKQTNEIMLGERDSLSVDAVAAPVVSSMMAGGMLGTTDTAPAPMEINIVQQFLMQREDPKPLFTEMSVKEKDSQIAKVASGYNPNLFFDRNWREATLGLAVYIKQ